MQSTRAELERYYLEDWVSRNLTTQQQHFTTRGKWSAGAGMTGKRRPLHHNSASLFQPPLSRSSHSAPQQPTPGPNKPPLFSSSSESKSPSKPNSSERSNTLLNSFSSCQTSSSQRSLSISNQGSEEQLDRKSSVVCISTRISSFMCMSSQIGLHVAQTVVSDILSSPKAPSKSLDPDTILDSLIEQIKEDVKQRYNHTNFWMSFSPPLVSLSVLDFAWRFWNCVFRNPKEFYVSFKYKGDLNLEKKAVKYCRLRGTTFVSVFLLASTNISTELQPIGQLLSLLNNNSLLLSIQNT